MIDVAAGPDLDFGAWLRGWMAVRGVSQRHLAVMAGVHHGAISRILSGREAPSLRTADRLARALDARLVLGDPR